MKKLALLLVVLFFCLTPAAAQRRGDVNARNVDADGTIRVTGAGTLQGVITFWNGLVLDGTTYTTTLDWVDPTADRTVTIPDRTGDIVVDPVIGYASDYAVGSSTCGIQEAIDAACTPGTTSENPGCEIVLPAGVCTLTDTIWVGNKGGYCSTTTTMACLTDSDCPGAETCSDPAAAELTNAQSQPSMLMRGYGYGIWSSGADKMMCGTTLEWGGDDGTFAMMSIRGVQYSTFRDFCVRGDHDADYAGAERGILVSTWNGRTLTNQSLKFEKIAVDQIWGADGTGGTAIDFDPHNPIRALDSGTASAAEPNGRTLTVAGTPWSTSEWVGDRLVNVTDGSWCTITSNTTNTANCCTDEPTCSAGGLESNGAGEDDWDIGESYEIRDVYTGVCSATKSQACEGHTDTLVGAAAGCPADEFCIKVGQIDDIKLEDMQFSGRYHQALRVAGQQIVNVNLRDSRLRIDDWDHSGTTAADNQTALSILDGAFVMDGITVGCGNSQTLTYTPEYCVTIGSMAGEVGINSSYFECGVDDGGACIYEPYENGVGTRDGITSITNSRFSSYLNDVGECSNDATVDCVTDWDCAGSGTCVADTTTGNSTLRHGAIAQFYGETGAVNLSGNYFYDHVAQGTRLMMDADRSTKVYSSGNYCDSNTKFAFKVTGGDYSTVSAGNGFINIGGALSGNCFSSERFSNATALGGNGFADFFRTNIRFAGNTSQGASGIAWWRDTHATQGLFDFNVGIEDGGNDVIRFSSGTSGDFADLAGLNGVTELRLGDGSGDVEIIFRDTATPDTRIVKDQSASAIEFDFDDTRDDGNDFTVTTDTLSGPKVVAVTTLDVPSGATPTVTNPGELAIDTDDDQLIYYGGAKRVLQHSKTFCVDAGDLSATPTNVELFMDADPITITAVGCHCAGTCTTPATISLEDRSDNAMTHTSPTCSTGTGSATFQGVTANNTLTAGEGLRYDVDNTPSADGDHLICVQYTTTAQ